MSLGHVTVFEPLSAVHLFKDVGMFAAGLAKVDNSVATVIHGGTDVVEVPLQLRRWVKTFRIQKLDGWCSRWALLCFIRQGQALSVTLYHATRENLVFALLLRLVGMKVYLKLDMNRATAERLTETWSKNWRPSSWIVQALFGAPHLVSCEDIVVYRKLKAFPWASRRLQLVPNAMLEDVAPVAFSSSSTRSNNIVISGRLGTREKNNEMILRALEQVRPSGLADWQFHFCGPSTPEFRELVSNLTARRPDLGQAIFLRGELDRIALFETYLQSKVLLVTSRSEGFSLAALEAAWAGCLIASTPVGGMDQLTDDWRLGYRLIDDDASSLVEFLEQISSNALPVLAEFERRKMYVHREFKLENHAARILKALRPAKSDR